MGAQARAGGRYIIPIDSNGAEVAAHKAPGVFTLTAGATYYYIIGGDSAPYLSLQLTGYSSALIITSATIQDCNHSDKDVTNFSTTAGEWVDFDPSSALVTSDGAGWTVTNGVLAVAGGALGGAIWHLIQKATCRARLAVVVGGTGGDARVSMHGKD